MNLTFETLDGILKHNGPIDIMVPDFVEDFLIFKGTKKDFGSFESQIAAICDDNTYNNNDIDDGLYAGLFDIEKLSEISLVKNVLNKIKFRKEEEKRFNYEIVRGLIKLMINDLIENTNRNLKNLKICSYEDVLSCNQKIVSFSKDMGAHEISLKEFLKKNMYEHPRVKRMTLKAKKIISDLFDLYLSEPSLLPEQWRNVDKK